MNQTLLDAARRFAAVHADTAGQAVTPITGLTLIRAVAPSPLEYQICRPLVALVLQGEKQVNLGGHGYLYAAGESLLITADVPTTSRIRRASVESPYLSMVFDLDFAIIAELGVNMQAQGAPRGSALRHEVTDGEIEDAALRLLRLADRPASLPILEKQLLRELHYWLLAGRHGAAIGALGHPDSMTRRIAKVVAVMREKFAEALPVQQLAGIAGMSPSSFHQHFRAVTSLSPLQFQKQLRLIQARRLLLATGGSAGNIAYAVGYESVPQFTREYGRMFGVSPVRDARTNRLERAVAA